MIPMSVVKIYHKAKWHSSKINCIVGIQFIFWFKTSLSTRIPDRACFDPNRQSCSAISDSVGQNVTLQFEFVVIEKKIIMILVLIIGSHTPSQAKFVYMII
jgi:hypothetical protein